MKISVITPRYAISGVPLAQWRFARALAHAGHSVDLIIGNCDAHLTVPPIAGVAVQVLGAPNVRSMLRPLIRHFRSARPDIVFSAEDHLNVMVQLAAILARSRAKISGSSRVTPFDTYSSEPLKKRWFLKQAARMLNWRADALTCVSQDMVTQYATVFPGQTRHAVYNIVSDRTSQDRLAQPVSHPWLGGSVPLLVAAGTLAPWKGFADLIDAVAVLREQGCDTRLLILGEGPLRAELEQRVARLGLDDRVALPGYVDNPLPYYREASAFVLSSHIEGMPNVLIEAMMAGCTPVSTDCPTGPAEVLKGGRYGYLAPVGDPAGLAKGIIAALDAPIAPEILAEAIAPFEEARVLKRHFEILGISQAAA